MMEQDLYNNNEASMDYDRSPTNMDLTVSANRTHSLSFNKLPELNYNQQYIVDDNTEHLLEDPSFSWSLMDNKQVTLTIVTRLTLLTLFAIFLIYYLQCFWYIIISIVI